MLSTNSCRTLSWHLAQIAGTFELGNRSLGIAYAQNVVLTVTVGANCGCAELRRHRLPVNAFLNRREGGGTPPDEAMTNFWPWHAPQVFGTLARATLELGSLAAIPRARCHGKSLHFADGRVACDWALAWNLVIVRSL